MRILIVEWTRSPWIDVRPRLSAGQLSCLARLARTCAVASVPAAAAAQWHVADVLAVFRAGDGSVSAFGDGELPAEHRVQPDGLDPRIFQLFPAWPDARVPLAEALAELYSCHNAAVAALHDDRGFEIVAVRHEFIDSVDRCYRESPSLAQARAAAFRLLDLLLQDLLREAGGKCATVVIGRGVSARAGFCVFPRTNASSTPNKDVSHASLTDVLRTLADGEARIAAALPPRETAPEENWRRPLVTRIRPTSTSRASMGTHVRAQRAEDAPRLTLLFPRAAWPEHGTGFLLFSRDDEQALLGAAVLDERGGVTFELLAGVETGADLLLQAVLNDARQRGLSRLSNRSNIPVGDVRQRFLEAAGFTVNNHVTLWRLDLQPVLERMRSFPAGRGEWQLRPPSRDDLEHWRRRKDTTGLMRTGLEFDADLSFVAEQAGAPVALMLVRRVDKVACIELLVTAPTARRTDVLAELVRTALNAAFAGGLRTAIFTTDDERGEARALAHRFGAHELHQGARMTCELPEMS